jgi:hypothetical protein
MRQVVSRAGVLRIGLCWFEDGRVEGDVVPSSWTWTVMWNERRLLGYLEFRQMVRRYRPSDLVPVLASYSASLDLANGGHRVRSDGTDQPWIPSAIGRESVLYGNEYRSGSITATTMGDLYAAFNSTDDWPASPSVSDLMTPLLHEQFVYEESPFEELSRIFALLEDPTLGPSFDWRSLLGLDLHEAVRAALILRVWVARNGGRYDPSILDMPHFQEVFERAAPRWQIEATAAALTTTVDEAKEANRRVPAFPSHLQRFAFNPLVARPFVDLGVAGIWAPQTMYVERAFTAANLFYRGIAAWGRSFAEDLGDRVEAYVGRQLGLMVPEAELSPEIEYKVGRDLRKSVDWIWSSPRATVLFECKSARPTLGARAGDASLPQLVERTLVKAREQLDTTADLIRRQVPPFDQFSCRLPIVGVVVTCEPFYLANSRLPEYGDASDTPSLVMALREIEQWVIAPPDEALSELLEVLEDSERRTWGFGRAMKLDRGSQRNALLEAAWRRYDFDEVAGAAAD